MSADIQRLKFAMARGARIQSAPGNNWSEKWWYVCEWNWLPVAEAKDYGLRIHPDDAYLEYGPLSSALREWATSTPESDWCDAAMAVYRDAAQTNGWWSNDIGEIRMSILFFAEMLADEGL